MKNEYGVEVMSFDDEMKLFKEHPSLHKTRLAKTRLGVAFRKMANNANYMIDYCKSIPEEDEEAHADLVQNFAIAMEILEENMVKIIENCIYKKG